MSLFETTLEEIRPCDAAWRARAPERLDQLTMPHWALGRLMDLAVDLAGMTRSTKPPVSRKAIVTIAQNAWRRIGVKCNTRLIEWAVFLNDFVNVGEFDAVVLGWSTGFDADQYQIWHSSQTGPQQLNFVGYESEEVDGLIEAIRVEYDRDQQRELAHQLHRVVAADQPYTFLYAARATQVLDKKIVMVERDSSGAERFTPLRPTPTDQLMYYFRKWRKLDHVPDF